MSKQAAGRRSLPMSPWALVAVLILVALSPLLPGEDANPLGDNFTYDLDKLRKTDPALILYTEADPIALPLKDPSAITIDADDHLLVAGKDEILRFAPANKTPRRWAVDGHPTCLTVDLDGRLYVGMRDHVETWTQDGKQTARWDGLGERARLTSIAVSTDTVYVADAGGRIVRTFDPAGKPLGKIGARDPKRNIRGFIIPSPHFDLAVAADDSLWVVNPGRQTLENYRPNGDLITTWQQRNMRIDGFCGCCNPTDIALLRDGSFVTSEKGLPRVKIYGPTGVFTGVVAGSESFAADVVGLDLAVDSNGHIFVLDPDRRQVRIFVPTPKKGTVP